MKRHLLLLQLLFVVVDLKAQVTQINNNNSLIPQTPITSTLTLLVSKLDSSIWVTDGTLGGTVQISSTIKFEAGAGSLAPGKFLFRGSDATNGSELFVTDGTPGGTMLVADINSGATGSRPSEFAPLNGFLYFKATTSANGRELWRSDGTSVGTTLVKDIVPGPDSSFNGGIGVSPSVIFSSGTLLLFAANTPASGNELWISDGSPGGTSMLKEIDTGNANANSSNPKSFFLFNGKVLFTATDSGHGDEFWITDGTPGGTSLLKDIHVGPGSSTSSAISPSFSIQVFMGFHPFNNKLYFQAYDGTSTGELWVTDGTPGNTTLVKEIFSSVTETLLFLGDAENLTSKFFFSGTDEGSRFEIWESDGTPGGTVLFKSFDPICTCWPPVIIPTLSVSNGNLTYPLFKGSKFFFIALTITEGYELWITDGTIGGTNIVKDLNPGTANAIAAGHSISFLYTTDSLFFAASDGTTGNELWRTDGTSGGTTLEKDINPGAADSDPVFSFFTNHGKFLFNATDGDVPNAFDLFTFNGVFTSLPLKLADFTVSLLDTRESLLKWSTTQEINTKNFVIERSWEGQKFEPIGTVGGAGTSSLRHEYSFKDPGTITTNQTRVYYRLLMNDLDGKSEYSKVISLNLNGDARWNVRLLTNPVQDNPTLILSGISGNLNLSIHDINGKTVYSRSVQNINGQLTVPVSLQRGVYILEAEYNNERKIIRFLR